MQLFFYLEKLCKLFLGEWSVFVPYLRFQIWRCPVYKWVHFMWTSFISLKHLNPCVRCNLLCHSLWGNILRWLTDDWHEPIHNPHNKAWEVSWLSHKLLQPFFFSLALVFFFFWHSYQNAPLPAAPNIAFIITMTSANGLKNSTSWNIHCYNIMRHHLLQDVGILNIPYTHNSGVLSDSLAFPWKISSIPVLSPLG